MTPSQIRSYSRSYNHQPREAADFLEIIQSIPTLTKLGAVFLVMGKFMGVMAIPAAFIPSLNVLVVPLIFAWGSLVFCAIGLCSVDHFRKKKAAQAAAEESLVSEESIELYEQLENQGAVIIPLAVGQ